MLMLIISSNGKIIIGLKLIHTSSTYCCKIRALLSFSQLSAFLYRDFITVCNDALDLNAKLITTEQKEYHESLKSGFTDIVNRLSKMFGETVCILDLCLKVTVVLRKS